MVEIYRRLAVLRAQYGLTAPSVVSYQQPVTNTAVKHEACANEIVSAGRPPSSWEKFKEKCKDIASTQNSRK